MRTPTNRADPDYGVDYAATRTDRILAGVRPLYVPSDASTVTCTGAPFHVDDAFAADLKGAHVITFSGMGKAQQIMLNLIRSGLDDSMFPTLNKTLPASDLLQKFWMLLANKIHRFRSHILKYVEQWSMTPLATAADFYSALRQYTALATAKNILEYKLPLDLNPDFTAQLLTGLRRNIDSAPIDIRHDMTSVVDELIRLGPDVHLPASALTIAIGSLYPDPPIAVDKQPDDNAMIASLPSLRLVSSDATDYSSAQTAFVAQPAHAGYQRRGNDTQPRSVDRPRSVSHRSEDSRPRPTSRAGPRRDDSPPPDDTLERLQQSFRDLQSDLAQHCRKTNAAQGAKNVQHRQQPPKAAALYSSHKEPDTIDQAFDSEYALHARAQLAANDAYSRELTKAQSFDLPSEYEYDS
uniref:Uncharacterized protein n=1 Tax=Cryptomonas curvata TaxID=233186 RepID=A0A6T8DTG6_9CRYP|mmetsp:Transcript_60204/g.125947  ORF Transcript_60204/g.125947 Transcript_60204/m.125947 type:complete len:409 (+) Transcript_60204:2266-3492(+)|eukprot:CAMPEP_0172172080 /NCGR_PEP_ID=MMETSP1050-20130122/12247_1 /TAXON_ID=233186 /ORGANISM="Cryptomonas curvata, Strain CCAP979/52" /LENGTH=408 /DNA_ID=CAMNT_0012843579 /DNA_START=392 /DNA_END=1618 /DNA_ORIENTATION=+